MPHKKRHTADDNEIQQGTGRSIEAWDNLLNKKGQPCASANELSVRLLDEYKLPMYWAHSIAYHLAERAKEAGGQDVANANCHPPRLGV